LVPFAGQVHRGADTTHWHLADGTDVEILNASTTTRLLVPSDVFTTVKAADVVQSFYAATDCYGFPAAYLTDNGAVTAASRARSGP